MPDTTVAAAMAGLMPADNIDEKIHLLKIAKANL